MRTAEAFNVIPENQVYVTVVDAMQANQVPVVFHSRMDDSVRGEHQKNGSVISEQIILTF